MIKLNLIEGETVEVPPEDIKSVQPGSLYADKKTVMVVAIDRTQPKPTELLLVAFNPLEPLLTELLSLSTPCPRFV